MLVKINVLSQRHNAIRSEIANFLFLCTLVFTISLVFTLGTSYYYSSVISDKQEHSRHLKGENKKLSKLVEDIKNIDSLRNAVKSKIGVIELLKNGRYHTFAKLSSITSSKPSKTWITEIKDDGNNIYISGYSVSTAEVSDFMRQIEEKDVFNSVDLKLVKREIKEGDIELNKFTLVVNPRFKEEDIVSRIDGNIEKKAKKRPRKKVNHGANHG